MSSSPSAESAASITTADAESASSTAAAVDYLTFDLYVDCFGALQWVVQVIGRGGVERSTTVQAPFHLDHIEREIEALDWIQTRDAAVDRRAAAVELGERLFATLFQGEVLEAWRATLGAADAAGQCVRLRLQLGRGQLEAIPWELLRDPEGDVVLSRSVERPLSRRPRARPTSRRTRSIVEPLRVLVVIGDDRGLEARAEHRDIVRALRSRSKSGAVTTELLEQPSRRELLDHLEKDDVHVLHFVGHGLYTSDHGEGTLVLQSPDRAPGQAEIDAESLADALRRSDVRLVVLNACESGRQNAGGSLQGVAEALLTRGVPAVVAMSAKITDPAARTFAGALYRSLATGEPVDVAASRARERMHRDSARLNEWALPILSLRTENPYLFQRAPRRRWSWWRTLPLVLAAGVVGGLIGWFWPQPEPFDPRCPPPAGLTTELVYIEAGDFFMGSEIESDERPVHLQVIEEPFCIGKYEVTRGEWATILGLSAEELVEGLGNPEEPITRVSKDRADEFIVQLNDGRRDERPFALPTEAQWEYAARAGSEDLYSFGDDPALLGEHGNCENDLGDGYEDSVSPVGRFGRNAWGLYDVHGNVWEWTRTEYEPYPEAAWEHEEDRAHFVRRGGSYEVVPSTCRVAFRAEALPHIARQDVGLRLVREPVEDDGLRVVEGTSADE